MDTLYRYIFVRLCVNVSVFGPLIYCESECVHWASLRCEWDISLLKMSGFRQEKVVRAWHVERPKQVKGPCNHHGTVVETDKGNSYLIHNTPGAGVVCTPASNMSSKWSKTREIDVRRDATVGECLRAGTARFPVHTPMAQYVSSGFCIGSSSNVDKYLGRQEGCIIL